LTARMVAVASAYDKLRHPWTAVPATGHNDAVGLLKAEAGRKFDPEIVDALSEVAFDTDEVGEAELLTLN